MSEFLTYTGPGAGAVPGGSSGQLQYNNAGVFDGLAGTSWDAVNRALTIVGAAVTTSFPVLNLSQTWNAGAVNFTGLKLNVTNTASNAGGSLLFDFQLGGVSQVYCDTTGRLYTYNGANLNNSTLKGVYQINSTSTNNNAYFGIGGALGINTFQFGNIDGVGVAAQTIRIQSVSIGTSNTAGVNCTITGSRGTGTGTGGDIVIQVAPAGSSGTAQNALVQAFRAYSDTTVFAGGGFTVGALPAAGTAGRRAYVTDAAAATFNAAVVGGGAVVTPVFDNGTAWVAG